MTNMIRNLINDTNGAIFTITFVKKDGSERVMNARTKVQKHLKGGESTTSHLNHLVTVYDLKSEGYRNINLTTVKQFKFGGKVVDFS